MGELSRYLLYFWVFCLPGINIYYIPKVGAITSILIFLSFIFAVASFIKKIRLKKHVLINKSSRFFLLLLFLFVELNLLSYFWSFKKGYVENNITALLIMLLIPVVMLLTITSVPKLLWMLKFYIAGCLVPIAGIFINYFSGLNYLGDSSRHSAAGFDPNDLGVVLSLSIPMAWYIITNTKNKLLRFIVFLYIPLAITAILFTASRGALLTLAASMLIIPLSYFRIPTNIKIISFLILITVTYTIIFFAPQDSIQRLSSVKEEIVHGDLNQRGEIWQTGAPIFLDHWIVGVGSNNYRAAYKEITGEEKVAHNTFISITSETGLVGISIYLLILISLLLSIRYARDRDKSFLSTFLLTWLIGTSSLTWDFLPFTYAVFGIIVLFPQLHDYETYEKNPCLKQEN